MRKNNFNRRKNMREIEEKDFSKEVGKGVTLVDFFATWCMPCRMMGQILEDVAGEMGDKVNIVKVDVDKNENLAKEYGVMSIPTLCIFKDGKEQEKHIGVWQFEDCVNTLKKYL